MAKKTAVAKPRWVKPTWRFVRAPFNGGTLIYRDKVLRISGMLNESDEILVSQIVQTLNDYFDWPIKARRKS